MKHTQVHRMLSVVLGLLVLALLALTPVGSAWEESREKIAVHGLNRSEVRSQAIAPGGQPVYESSADNPTSTSNALDAITHVEHDGTHFLKIDLRERTFHFLTAIPHHGQGGREQVSVLAQRYGAVAAINADYWSWVCGPPPYHNCAEGMTFVNGEEVTYPDWGVQYNRSSLALSDANQANIGKGYDGRRSYLHNVVGGGPQFVFDGSYRWDWVQRGQDSTINGEAYKPPYQYWYDSNGTSKWTAAGISEDGNTLILATSYQAKTPQQMANLMIGEGAWNVMKFDGGGSATMWFNGQLLVWDQVDGEREIADALLVLPGPPAGCNDTQDPDGDYTSPGNGQQVRDGVLLKGWARDDCEVDYVEFTATWPGRGWHVIERVDTDCGQGQTCDYEHTWDLSGVPGDTTVTLGFDIYDKSGKRSLSPHGTRRILKVGQCAAPGLREPGNDSREPDRTLTFRWNNVDCTHDGFRLRVKNTPDMNGGGTTYLDTQVGSTDFTCTFDGSGPCGNVPENTPLYWSVKAANAPGEASWAPARVFQVVNDPPHVSFDQADSISITQNGQAVEHRDPDWNFSGTANDPETQLSHVDFHCWGNNCNGTQRAATPGYTWSYSRSGLEGHNRVHFYAYDNIGQRNPGSDRHYIDLYVDRAAPRSNDGRTGTPGRNGWYRSSVNVRLSAEDQGTGGGGTTHGIRNHFKSGVKEIHYRLDDAGWQTRSSSIVDFVVTGDGTHTVAYYAVDRVGNAEQPPRNVTFKIDRTPPDPPSGGSETYCGAVNDQWQNACNTPTFTWDPVSDTTPGSGVWGYHLYFGTDSNGEVVHEDFTESEQRRWTPKPNGVRTGTYYLRGRTGDNAGNWSPWTTLFTFRYDGTPPQNPSEATHRVEGVVNDTWQRTTSLADFTWLKPHDEGSGIKGYHVYWGTVVTGTSTSFITSNQYQSAAPLCGVDEACTGYLRLQSVDNVDNVAEDWSTAFMLRYDNAPPVADFTFNGGVTQTTQTLVTLHITATDEGSGVREMRLSGDGRRWTDWEVYASERPWTIPAISRQWWPVYLQVRDGVELASAVISHTIYLDVNPQQPRSESFRLFDHAMSAGAGEHTSVPTGYQGRSTVGQVVDSPQTNSLNYIITGGYEAGSRALPIEEPGHDEFTFINGIFASGTGADTLQSPLYQMLGTLGEVGLPNNETTVNSSGFQHQPGFLAAAPPSGTPTPTPTPGPTPTPEPEPACEFPTISINEGDLFTNSTDVTLSICAPRAEEMMISNDGGFGDAEWEPYAESKPWTITTYGQYVLPRFVYAVFKDADATVHGVYFDDIIYDPNPPTGTIAVGDSVGTSNVRMLNVGMLERSTFNTPLALLSTQIDGTVDLYLNAQDDNSGVAEMQLSISADFSGAAEWELHSALKLWTPEGGDGIKTIYARFRDSAGNISDTSDTSFVLDRVSPVGGIYITDRAVGPGVVTTTLYLDTIEDLSGMADMRISADLSFTDALWQPYSPRLDWPIDWPTEQSQETLYVQYRDLAGNVSEVYSDTYRIDTTLPQLYVEVASGDTLTRTVSVLAYDELTEVATMHLSNDPSMFEGVVTLPYTDTVEWVFDERRVVWVQVEDSVGIISEPYPAYAAPAATCDLVGDDGVITVEDVAAVAARWREELGAPHDRDDDNRVTVADIMWYAARWGQGCQ